MILPRAINWFISYQIDSIHIILSYTTLRCNTLIWCDAHSHYRKYFQMIKLQSKWLSFEASNHIIHSRKKKWKNMHIDILLYSSLHISFDNNSMFWHTVLCQNWTSCAADGEYSKRSHACLRGAQTDWQTDRPRPCRSAISAWSLRSQNVAYYKNSN